MQNTLLIQTRHTTGSRRTHHNPASQPRQTLLASRLLAPRSSRLTCIGQHRTSTYTPDCPSYPIYSNQSRRNTADYAAAHKTPTRIIALVRNSPPALYSLGTTSLHVTAPAGNLPRMRRTRHHAIFHLPLRHPSS